MLRGGIISGGESGDGDRRSSLATAHAVALEAIPSGDELSPPEGVRGQTTTTTSTTMMTTATRTIATAAPPCGDGSEAHDVGPVVAGTPPGASSPGGLRRGRGGGDRDGLRCVGIEYNQALAESAQDNVRRRISCVSSSTHRADYVMERVCVRWGDVLEEWNRGHWRVPGKDEVVGHRDDDNDDGGGGGYVHRVSRRGGYGGDGDIRGEGENEEEVDPEEAVDAGNDTNCYYDAGELTLLDDATAVFVYLLPKGLEKIKRILYDAAVIRHRQRERKKVTTQNQPRWQMQLREQQHPLHPLQELQLLGVASKEDTSLTNASEDDQDGVEFCPLPPRHRRKRGDSHVSDITEDSFYHTRTSLEGMGLGNINTMEVLRILHEEESYGLTVPRLVSSTPQPQTPPKKEKETIVPSFRVVSYMFSIPGWTPAVVDRSSKGQCPLYLYETIHDEPMTPSN